MVAIKNILLLVTAVSALPAAVFERDASTVLSDISTIQSDVTALDKAVKAYNGGLTNALPIVSAEMTLDNDINKATNDTKASTALSKADSDKGISAVKALIPAINTTLSDLIAKKADFAADGLTSIVQSDLATLSNDTNTFATALIAKVDPSDLSTAKSLKASIKSLFAKAESAFAS